MNGKLLLKPRMASEWMVMPFGLSNTSNTFMRLMTYVLQPFLGKFVVIYFDDILVYSKTREQHLEHLRQLFCILREAMLFTNLKKCLRPTSGFLFGVHYVRQGISADPDEVKAIKEWPEPKIINEARSFHGLTSFYTRFIRRFSSIMAPVTDYLRKGSFQWTSNAALAFRDMKERMVSAPILRHPNFSKVF